MSNLFRKIGEEFASSDKTGIKALLMWLSILLAAAIFMFAGTLQSRSWMVLLSLALIAALLVIDLVKLLVVDLGGLIFNKLSSWWDDLGKEAE